MAFASMTVPSVVVSVCRIGAALVTSTVSLTLPTFNWKSSLATWLITSSTFGWTALWNPVLVTFTS